MGWARVSVIGLAAVVGLGASGAQARHHHHRSMACCHIAAGTPIRVELTDPISVKSVKAGDSFGLKLSEPLVIDHHLVLRAGVIGVGQVIQAEAPGIGGKPAKLVLAARYLEVNGRQTPIGGLQLSGVGRDNSKIAQAIGIGGIAFAPLGIVGIVLPGGDVTLKAGAEASAQFTEDEMLPALGPAPRGAISIASASDEVAAGPLQIAPPPPGKGVVVFFRPKSILGTAQWFKVRENGQALGRLDNGAYFVEVTDPGLHTYTDSMEPELKDHLTLQVDAGVTYYVEGSLTKGLLLSAADLTPSDRAAFEKSAGQLKLAVSEPAKVEAASLSSAQPAAAVVQTAQPTPASAASTPATAVTAPDSAEPTASAPAADSPPSGSAAAP